MDINSVKIDNKPLSSKIIRWSILVLGSILFVFCLITLVVVQIRFSDVEDEHLRDEANFIIKSISVQNGQLLLSPEIYWEEEHHMERAENPINILIFNKDRSLFYSTKGFVDTSFANENLIENINSNMVKSVIHIVKKNIRFIVHPIIFNNENFGWLITSMVVDRLNIVTRILLMVYLIIFPFSLLIAYLGSIITAKTVVRPIQRISDVARNIQLKNPNKRLPVPQTKDEIAHLAITLNNLLDNVENNIQNMRRFSQNASHELKSPLVLITAELEQLLPKIKDSSISEGFYHIQQEVTRMAKIIDSLLTLMKIDSKQSDIKKQTVWLNDLLFEEITRYQQRIKNKKIKVVSDKIKSLSVIGDPYWLSTMISNLLDNAIKYTAKSSNIIIGLEKKSYNTVLFTIEDEGPGVDKADIPLLTKRFYSQESRNNMKGSGLGLSIVEWIVNSHNGQMVIENAIKSGLRISITLPC